MALAETKRDCDPTKMKATTLPDLGHIICWLGGGGSIGHDKTKVVPPPQFRPEERLARGVMRAESSSSDGSHTEMQENKEKAGPALLE